jgi:predicted DNA-binding transcriptional regulator AlpA
MESTRILAAVADGYLRQVDMVPLLGVTQQRVGQIVDRDDFPSPALVIGSRRLWLRADVDRWIDARPRAWAPAGG